MAFWSNLFKRGGDVRKVGVQSPQSSVNRSGSTTVTFDSAMTTSAFWASVRLLSETVAAMPLKCYEVNQETGIKQPKKGYDLYKLLNYSPNRYQTRTEFFESLMLNLVTNGNSYCLVTRAVTGRIVSLSPLVSSQMLPILKDDGSVVYQYSTANNKTVTYTDKQIWQTKLFGNGIVGMSPLSYAAASIKTSEDLENRSATLAGNGGKTTGILTVDQKLNPDQRAKVKSLYSGIETGSKENGLFVLESGMIYQQTALSPADVQLLESRHFSVEDVARFMGVPSVLINDTSGTTAWGSGIEQINMGFYKLNLRPYLERIESSLKRWLMDSSDWESVDIEFDFDALLRADKATRLDAAGKAINSGQLTPNEARANEGLGPLAGGDEIYLNGSLVPAGATNQESTNDGS